MDCRRIARLKSCTQEKGSEGIVKKTIKSYYNKSALYKTALEAFNTGGFYILPVKTKNCYVRVIKMFQ